MSDIKKLQEQAHKNSVDHGFWDEPQGDEEVSRFCDRIAAKLCLIHSEISEALEELRIPQGNAKRTLLRVVHVYEGKPIGFPTELADATIRILDLCEYLGIDLGAEIERKMAYNVTRAYKHGGKAL